MAEEALETQMEIAPATTRGELVRELLEADWLERTFDPVRDSDADSRLDALRSSWSTEGYTTVLTSGAYDLVHLDHCAYLLDTKLQGSERHYARHYECEVGETWAELSEPAQEALMERFLANGEIKLIVSVDGNEKVARRKSGRTDKGGGNRPIMDWETRSRLVSALSIELHENRLPLVDAVTVNDPLSLAGTRNEDLFEQVASLQPEVWAAYFESEYIFEEAPLDHRLREVEIRKITATNRFTDRLIGNFSSSAVLKRLQD